MRNVCVTCLAQGQTRSHCCCPQGQVFGQLTVSQRCAMPRGVGNKTHHHGASWGAAVGHGVFPGSLGFSVLGLFLSRALRGLLPAPASSCWSWCRTRAPGLSPTPGEGGGPMGEPGLCHLQFWFSREPWPGLEGMGRKAQEGGEQGSRTGTAGEGGCGWPRSSLPPTFLLLPIPSLSLIRGRGLARWPGVGAGGLRSSGDGQHPHSSCGPQL